MKRIRQTQQSRSKFSRLSMLKQSQEQKREAKDRIVKQYKLPGVVRRVDNPRVVHYGPVVAVANPGVYQVQPTWSTPTPPQPKKPVQKVFSAYDTIVDDGKDLDHILDKLGF